MKDVNATVVVDISKSEDDIFNGLKKQTKTGIRKAMKEGLVVEESQEWNEAYEVYKDTRKRNNTIIRPLDKLKEWADKLFVCKKDGKIIAINITWFIDLYDKNVPRTMTNSFLRDYAHLRPNELLYWEIFKHYKSKGYKQFDLGGYAVKPRENLEHVNTFKENFGEVVYFQRDYPFYKAIGRKLVRNFDILWKLNRALKLKQSEE